MLLDPRIDEMGTAGGGRRRGTTGWARGGAWFQIRLGEVRIGSPSWGGTSYKAMAATVACWSPAGVGNAGNGGEVYRVEVVELGRGSAHGLLVFLLELLACGTTARAEQGEGVGDEGLKLEVQRGGTRSQPRRLSMEALRRQQREREQRERERNRSRREKGARLSGHSSAGWIGRRRGCRGAGMGAAAPTVMDGRGGSGGEVEVDWVDRAAEIPRGIQLAVA